SGAPSGTSLAPAATNRAPTQGRFCRCAAERSATTLELGLAQRGNCLKPQSFLLTKPQGLALRRVARQGLLQGEARHLRGLACIFDVLAMSRPATTREHEQQNARAARGASRSR